MKSAYILLKFSRNNINYRILLRNHWKGTFYQGFIITCGYNYQGLNAKVFNLGLFIIALSVMVIRSL